MNKVEFFKEILKQFGTDADIREFAEQELMRLQQTPATDKWQDIKNNILNEMQKGVWYTVCEMKEKLSCCEEFAVQKVSALVRQLYIEQKIHRFEYERRVYYALA